MRRYGSTGPDIFDCPRDIASDIRRSRLVDDNIATDVRRMCAGAEDVTDGFCWSYRRGDAIERRARIAICITKSAAIWPHTRCKRHRPRKDFICHLLHRREQLVRVRFRAAVDEHNAVTAERYDNIAFRLSDHPDVSLNGIGFEQIACRRLLLRSSWKAQTNGCYDGDQD